MSANTSLPGAGTKPKRLSFTPSPNGMSPEIQMALEGAQHYFGKQNTETLETTQQDLLKLLQVIQTPSQF